MMIYIKYVLGVGLLLLVAILAAYEFFQNIVPYYFRPCVLFVVKYRRTAEYRELKNYLHSLDRKVRLCVAVGTAANARSIEEEVYNCRASGKKKVCVSISWYKRIIKNSEAMKQLKTTLCHELYHINENRKNNLVWRIRYRIKTLNEAYVHLLWWEELCADLYSVDVCGKDEVLAKMDFMKNNTSVNQEVITDHPPWAIRIEYVYKYTEGKKLPSIEEVKTLYFETKRRFEEERKAKESNS